MKRVRTLYQLQGIETDIEQKSRRLKEVEGSLTETDALREARAVFEKAQKRLKEARVRLQRLEGDNQSLQTEIADEERRLYGGRITIPKELRSLEEKIKNLKKRRSKLEDDVLETMVVVEEGEAQQTESQAILAQIETEWQTSQASLIGERDRLKANLAKQMGDRDALRATIPPKDLSVYENLYRRKGGQSVVRVQDGTCRACGVSVSARQVAAITSDDELVPCSNCERILYMER